MNVPTSSTPIGDEFDDLMMAADPSGNRFEPQYAGQQAWARRMFYAGAVAMRNILANVAHPDVPEARGALLLAVVDEEIKEFVRDLKGTPAR